MNASSSLPLLVLTACASLAQAPSTGPGGSASQRAASQMAPDELFRFASPSVVQIVILDEDDREIGTGSGFVVATSSRPASQPGGGQSWECSIATNYHVIWPAVTAAVRFADGATRPAGAVLAESEAEDVAILRVDLEARPPPLLTLAAFIPKGRRFLSDAEVFGPVLSQCPPVGMQVFAIGSPRGLHNTLSEGLISGFRQEELREWIQITAPVSPGSSGGPVLTADGRVIGITTASIEGGQNLNFAVSAVKVAALLRSKSVPRPVWKGASVDREWESEVGELLNTALAEQQTTSAPGRGPSNERLLLILHALREYRAKSYAEAAELFKAATKETPRRFLHLAYYGLAISTFHADANKWSDMIPDLERSRDSAPGFAPAQRWLAFAYGVAGNKNKPEALMEADALVRLVPRYWEGYQLRGMAWSRFGRVHGMERDYARALALKPDDAQLYSSQADAYDNAGQYENAIRSYENSIRLHRPGMSRGIAYYNFGMTCERARRYEKAIECFEAARTDGWLLMVEEGIERCRAAMAQR